MTSHPHSSGGRLAVVLFVRAVCIFHDEVDAIDLVIGVFLIRLVDGFEREIKRIKRAIAAAVDILETNGLGARDELAVARLRELHVRGGDVMRHHVVCNGAGKTRVEAVLRPMFIRLAVRVKNAEQAGSGCSVHETIPLFCDLLTSTIDVNGWMPYNRGN